MVTNCRVSVGENDIIIKRLGYDLEKKGRMEDKGKIGNLRTATSDDDFTNILSHIKSSENPAVIKYGAPWCPSCSHILPAFCRLSNYFPKFTFVYADIDKCPETTQKIRYTPTFQFYRNGEKVDEMYGIGEERLHDRLWLHS